MERFNITTKDLVPQNGGKAVIGVLTIISNLVVVVSSGLILKKKQEPRSTYLFLGNQALADLMWGVLLLYFAICRPSKESPVFLHMTILVLKIAFILMSVFSVGLIAVDRFLYILYGMRYASWFYPTRTRILILITWVVALSIGFIPITRGVSHFKELEYLITNMASEDIRLISIIGMIPLPVIIVLYSIILYQALRKISHMKNAATTNSSNNLRIFVIKGSQTDGYESTNSNKNGIFNRYFKKKSKYFQKGSSKWNAIKIVTLTTGLLAVTWFPFFLALFIFSCQCDRIEQNEKCLLFTQVITKYLVCLGTASNILNPVIYAWWHKGFRKFMKNKLYLLHRQRKHSTTTPTVSSKYNF